MTAALPVQKPVRTKLVALVGNPNTGKSTLFSALTGVHQRIGNYPGVTVERRSGRLRQSDPGAAVEIVDLPGTYSLGVHQEDEAIVLDVLLARAGNQRAPDLIVSVVDASNLRRNLFLTTQILELERPVIVVLNMTDVAISAGTQVDVAGLSAELGVPVIPTVATRQIGIEDLVQAINRTGSAEAVKHCQSFPDCVCAELDGLCSSIHCRVGSDNGHRAEAMQTLLAPGGYHELRVIQRCGIGMAEELAERRGRIQAAGESVVEVEARVRYAWIDRVLDRVVTRTKPLRRARTEQADRVLTHPLVGVLVLLVVMALGFQAIYSWAAPLMDGIDGAISGLGAVVSGAVPAGALRSLLVDGMIAGVGAVLVFLPQIVILFLFIAVLEDCGYMARAAFLLDRWMNLFGLTGKSFIPLLSSFACAVPGIMATRTIESRRDRFATILVAPLMSCSARLPVYVLLIGAFIPAAPLLGGVINLQAVTLLSMYFVGSLVAIPVALILKRTVLKGPAQSFLMELPTYKWPSFRTVFHRAYQQAREFCKSAGTIIFAVAIVVWALGYYPRPASIAAQFAAQRSAAQQAHAERVTALQSAQGVSAEAANAMDRASPSQGFEPELARVQSECAEELGRIDRDESGAYLRQSVLGRIGHWIEPAVTPLGWDWRIGMAALASFPAREVVIATIGTIYNLGDDQDESSVGLREKLQAATWPDGRPVFGVAVALSVMVFFALCCQCGATLATIKRETKSWRWPIFTFVYMTALAYAGAFLVFQVASRLVG